MQHKEPCFWLKPGVAFFQPFQRLSVTGSPGEPPPPTAPHQIFGLTASEGSFHQGPGPFVSGILCTLTFILYLLKPYLVEKGETISFLQFSMFLFLRLSPYLLPILRFIHGWGLLFRAPSTVKQTPNPQQCPVSRLIFLTLSWHAFPLR